MSRFSIDWSEFSLQVMVTFGHFLWQACVIGFVLFVAQHVGESLRDSQILRRRRSTKSNVSLRETDLRGANLRYTIACLAFFSLPICVVATFEMVHQSRGSIFLATNNPIETLTIPTASETRSNSLLTSKSVEGLGSPEMPAEPLLTSRAQLQFVEPIDKPDLTNPDTPWVERTQSFAPYLLIAYAIGVAMLLSRFGISIIGSSRLRRTLQPITDSNLLKVISEQSSRLGLKRVPIVALCQRVSVPVVVGIVKPMILLPPALLCGLDPNHIAAILTHEMAHIRRYDLIVNLVQRNVEALLFFHPVTWWISRSMSVERESCCDDVAAACTGRLSYASALLHMAELCIGNNARRRTALTALSADGGNITDFGYRIRRLIGAEEKSRIGISRRSVAVGLAMVLLVTFSFVAWGQSQNSAEKASEDGVVSSIFTPEPLWRTKLAADDVASGTLSRVSPVVVAGKRVLSIDKDFDLQTGTAIQNAFARRPRKNALNITLDPVFRRTSSDGEFFVDVSSFAMRDKFVPQSSDIRVLRATDGTQVGVTIRMNYFDGNTCDVDVENGGNFVLLGIDNEVFVYRTETGQVETTMPVRTKRVDAVAFCPDGKWLVVSDQNDLHFWRWRDQAPVKTIHAGRKIDSLVFTPDGQYLAEGPDMRKDIQIRDMRTLEIVASLKDEVGSPLIVSSMDISPNGRYLVAYNEVTVDPTKLTIPHHVHVWDLKERGKPVFQIATGERVRNVAFGDGGRMVVGEFSGAAHGALLAAWKLPDEVINRQVDSQRDAKDRLGDGIQWSRWGDENGLLSGARLILPEGGLKPGQPLVVEYRLANVSKEKKTLKCFLNKGTRFLSLGTDNRIRNFGIGWDKEPVTLTINPGEFFIDTKKLISIDTTGLEPGEYQVALGSAFYYPDLVEPNTTHELPHRGSIAFTIAGESTVKVKELPKSDIHWGKPISGLQVGARFAGDPTAIAIGATIEADLFVANVTDHPIECSVVLPHPQDGWLFNVEDQTRHTIMLQRPIQFSSPFPQQYNQLKLAPGEISELTSDQDKKDGRPSHPRAKFEVAKTKIDEQSWSDYTIKGRLVTQGGQYSAIFDVTLLRPEIPSMRLELDTGNVPFTVSKPGENGLAAEETDNTLEGIRQAVIQALQNPEIELGSNPIAPEVLPDFSRKLRAIPQKDRVIDSLFNILADPPAELDIDERRNALRYLIFVAPDRLKTLLIERLDTIKLLFPDTTGIALPYDEIDALGQMGEAASDAIPVLAKFLNAEEPEVRGTAIEALIRVGPRSSEVMQSIAKKFDDPHKVVRGLAVYQVCRYGKLANPLGLKLIELLNADTKEVQCWAAAALITSEFNPDLGFKKLLELIRAGSIVDRKLALSSLAMLGSRAESVLPQLRLMIDDRNTELAKEVRETIRRIETNDRIVTHAEEADKRTADLKQTPLTVQELSGEWSAKTNLVGLKCQLKSDPFDKGVRPLDVSVKVEIKFDQSEEAISRYAQFRLSQDVDSERNGGRKAMAGRLVTSQDGKEVNLVYHYRKEGVQGTQTRTVGKICRGKSGELLLTLFPPDSGIFDLVFDDFAPVEKLRLVQRDTNASNNDNQSSEEKLDSSKQSFKLIDGETGKPLQGLKCRAIFAKLNASPRYQACTTDEHGIVEVVVAEDESAGIAEVPSGWFSNGDGSVFVVQIPESEQQPQQNIEKRNEEPTVLKLWRGTEVDGRLLWPDKTPAAGVKLTAGVYINNQSWKEKLGMDLTLYSFDHGDWPNWSRMIVTDDDGKFRITVPPRDSRFWFRIGTTQLGFGPQTGTGEDETVSQRLAKCVPLEIQYGGNSRSTALIVHDIPETDDLVLHTGDLQLETGVIVRGRVVDAEGKGLSNVHLTTTGPHGPHSGRSATSGEDGKFEFPAMAAGNLVVHPDARLRDLTKPVHEQIISRDVQAVFVDQSFTIRSVFLPHEITVLAVPHTEVNFEWVDRRADKTQPIAFYGAFRVSGYMPDENGKPATYWTSETERVERNGKQWLTVKIPTQLLKPELMLVADSKVTASYIDSSGVTSGPGIVGLGDITSSTTRTIFGDEPREPADSKKSPQRARNDQSSWIPTRPLKVTASKEASAIILDDHSVRLEGDVQWQEVSLQFKFDKPTNVQEVRLEVLPVDSPTGPQFGRGGEELMLFDVKPSIQDQTGKFISLDFASCTYLQNPSDETSANCIDHLSDTGWKVPPLTADTVAHELVLRFEKPIALRADQRLTLTVDSGGAKELAVLNRIRFAFRQGAVSEPLSVNSTTSGSDVGALVTTGGVNLKVEPWEISKLYDAAFLRIYLQDHETLPKPIVVPAVSGKVLDPNGNPVSEGRIVSHTPRHWVDLDATLALKPHNSGGVSKSKQNGTFGLPERTEPYRVLLVHDSGVANVSHEELLRANGIVKLQKWASISGTLKLGGKPQVGETIVLDFDTLPWSYSRGGPRLTTTHRTMTDKDGNFSFDRVPPLGGMARSLRGHGAVYQCESGRNTHIEIGAGITVTGKLSFPEHVAKNKLKVYARNHLLPIPYPRDWTDIVTKEERNAWRVKWSSTTEGGELEDKNFILMNSYVPGSISEDGKFTFYGVPERPMVLVVAIPGEAILLEKPFDGTGSANDALDLGTLTVADHHDHRHDEVKQEGQPADKPQLPRMIVKTVDSDGKPVPDTGVLFYDRNSHRAGQKQKFEMVDRRTDESGVADFGVIPNSFGCLQLSPSNKGLAECYTLISTKLTKCTQAKPPRANVQTEIKDGILTVTFTMTPHVDLEFNIVDDATDEIVFWSEICYQDPTTDRWWMFGLVDGSKTQHNFIPISPQITREMIRISALGYETKVFRLPDELDRSKPIRRDVRLKPMPDVELKVLLHDGTPAEKAKLTFHYPNELDCLQIHEQLSDAQGIVTTKFPPSADIGILRLEHTGGTAELSMKELLDDAKQNSAEVVRRSIQLR